jgi:hypothetical protein
VTSVQTIDVCCCRHMCACLEPQGFDVRARARAAAGTRYQVPPEMGLPVGEHIRANDDRYMTNLSRDTRND